MKMRELLLFVEKKLVKPLEKISQQRHLVAVREGLLAVFPLSLIGTLFLLITTLPFPENWAVRQFIVAHENTILIPYRMTLVLIALYMVVSVGASLARYYKYSPVSGSLVALSAFLMTQIPTEPAAMVPQTFLQQAAAFGLDTTWMESLEGLGWVMPQTPMGGTAVYVGALSAILGVEILHLCSWVTERHTHKKRKKPQLWAVSQIPASLPQTVQTVIPVFLVVAFMFLIRDVLGFDLLKISTGFFSRLIGSATTLAIVLLLCLSKSKYLKRLGQSCLLPSLFNINTPVIYGLPVILNPYMLIPFVLSPMVTTLVSYLCLQLNLVARPYNSPSGSLPFAIGAFIATGDWKAILLCIFNLALSVAIYYPFFKIYEKKLLAEGEEKAAWEALNENEATVTTVE